MAKRRANGEGTIVKRPDGSFMGQVTVREGGLPKRRTLYARTQRELRVKMDEVKANPRSDKTTLASFLDGWLTEASLRVKPKTFHGYADVLNTHVIPALGSTKVDDLTPSDVRALLVQKVREGRSPKGIRDVLRNALQQRVDDQRTMGRLVMNVADVELPEVVEQKVEPYSAAQARVLLASLRKNPRWGPMLTVMLTTGVRRGELLGIERRHFVERDCGLVFTVRQQLQEFTLEKAIELHARPRSSTPWLVRWLPTTKGHVKSRAKTDVELFCLSTLKSADAVRDLPLLPHVAEMLRERFEGASLEPDDLVFRTPSGGAITTTSFWRAWKAATVAAKLPYVNPHGARHGVGSMLLEAGVDSKTIAAFLGHSDTGLIDRYVHASEAVFVQARDKLSELLG